jgi:hypothetical protein
MDGLFFGVDMISCVEQTELAGKGGISPVRERVMGHDAGKGLDTHGILLYILMENTVRLGCLFDCRRINW